MVAIGQSAKQEYLINKPVIQSISRSSKQIGKYVSTIKIAQQRQQHLYLCLL